ncbi:unnamed protein product, partial [marine sediment metagenome]
LLSAGALPNLGMDRTSRAAGFSSESCATDHPGAVIPHLNMQLKSMKVDPL